MTTTRDKILRAAVRTLADRGFTGTTARAVAGTGGFAPGVIYYHFKDLDDLFVATIAHTSQARMRRYESETADVASASDLLARLRALYAEDVAEGHIAAVQELVGAAATSARLAEQVRVEIAAWREFAARAIESRLKDSVLAAFVPTAALATTVVATYLGLEMLAHLDPTHDPEALFTAAEPLAVLLDSADVPEGVGLSPRAGPH